MAEEKAKTALGIDENIEGLLCYVLGWVSGIVFLILEKENRFVRFHAMQSLATFLVLSVAMMILPVIPIIQLLVIPVWILSLILWLLLMFKAFKGEMYKLPVVGDFAEKQVNK